MLSRGDLGLKKKITEKHYKMFERFREKYEEKPLVNIAWNDEKGK